MLCRSLDIGVGGCVACSLAKTVSSRVGCVGTPLSAVTFRSLFKARHGLFYSSVLVCLGGCLHSKSGLCDFGRVKVRILSSNSVLCGSSDPLGMGRFFVGSVAECGIRVAGRAVHLLRHVRWGGELLVDLTW